jgi:hypothetical protein
MSIKSHPPPKDEKWARWKYDMKKKWGPVYEKRIGVAVQPGSQLRSLTSPFLLPILSRTMKSYSSAFAVIARADQGGIEAFTAAPESR